jgi:hypothetical protein
LKHADYLVKNGKTIRSIVDGKIIEFENGIKRTIDTASGNLKSEFIWIDNLMPDPRKPNFHQNRLEIDQ